MKDIANLLLENGGWIIEDTQYHILVCRRQSGTPLFGVPFVRNDGEYILGKHIETREAGAPPIGPLPEHETNALLSEIIEHLSKAGISARIAD